MRQDRKMVVCREAAAPDSSASDSKDPDTEPSWLTSLGKLATRILEVLRTHDHEYSCAFV